MPDWWGQFLWIVIGIILLIVFINGCIKLSAYLRKRSEESFSYKSGSVTQKKSINALIIISLLATPTVLLSMSAINWLGKDESKDVFGFKRHLYEEKQGFETRSERRIRAFQNLVKYIFSLHGLVSILIAIFVFAPFSLVFGKIKKEVGKLERINGYWAVAVPIAMPFLILYGKS